MSKSKNSKGGKQEVSSSSVFCLITCGLPGSGKSTISKELEKYGWIRVNQDDLGTQEECKKIMHKALKHGKSVVVDRCNVHNHERKMWATEAKKFTQHIDCLFMDTPLDVCKRRAQERKNHPTLDSEKAEDVIDKFARGPYDRIFIVRTEEETKQVLKELSDYPVSTKKLGRGEP